MYVDRYYEKLGNHLEKGRVLVLYGQRQVGKTTLLQRFLDQATLKYRLDTGDNLEVREILSSQKLKLILRYAEDYQLVALDEAQHIPNIGLALKMLVDNRPDLYVIATGSSSFDLANQVGEPLTGRKKTLLLFPFAQIELRERFNRYDLKQKLEDFLIFGNYPEVFTAKTITAKRDKLNEITNSYLLKDLLGLERIKDYKILRDLLRLLAFQLGSEVSHNELAQQVGLDKKTVGRYLDLLEKTFVLFNLRGFSRNLRKEITKKSKYYFYDTGIRNAIITNFNPINKRDDLGQLWENFLVVERLKKQEYHRIYSSNYFWRTYDQKEIDWIEEREGKLFGYEFKWKSTNVIPPADWTETYKNSSFSVIHQKNYLDFIL